MHLENFRCTNFRSYSLVDCQFGPRLNCIVGDNGAGKTNILDAIHYLSLCRSPQGIKDSLNIKHNEPQFAIYGRFEGENPFDVSVGYSAERGKEVRSNGELYSRISEHVGRVPLVPIYPRDIELINDGGDLKRRFMNACISQYDHAYLEALLSYERLLKQRNAMLKTPQRSDDGLIEAYDLQLARFAQPVYEARESFCQQIAPLLQEHYGQFSPAEEVVALEYTSHLQQGSYLDLLREARASDRQYQFTTVGVHRDNLTLLLSGRPIKAVGSQGQQKAFVTALRLAQFSLFKEKLKTIPILLLDDLFDRLDSRRGQLLTALVASGQFGQIFLTDTQPERIIEALDYEIDEHLFFKATPDDFIPLEDI